MRSPIRKAVVDGLLGADGSAAVEPDWAVLPTALRHDDLTPQLLAAASDGASSQSLWWIGRFAAVAPDPALVPLLQRIAADSSLPAYPRRTAIAALGVVGGDEARRPIRDLLVADNDDDNEVLAAVVDVLYPDVITTEELLGALRPQHVGMIGGYQQVLRELPDRIPDTELTAVLARLADRRGRTWTARWNRCWPG